MRPVRAASGFSSRVLFEISVIRNQWRQPKFEEAPHVDYIPETPERNEAARKAEGKSATPRGKETGQRQRRGNAEYHAAGSRFGPDHRLVAQQRTGPRSPVVLGHHEQTNRTLRPLLFSFADCRFVVKLGSCLSTVCRFRRAPDFPISSRNSRDSSATRNISTVWRSCCYPKPIWRRVHFSLPKVDD